MLPLVKLEFDASAMPTSLNEIDEQLGRQLTLLRSQYATVVVAYTGIALSLRKRWMTYRQCRTLFKRMQLWWRVYGSVSLEVTNAVALLEAAAIRVKTRDLPNTDDLVFGNKVKEGGSGMSLSEDVFQYDGYLLTLCQGELTV